MPGNMYIGNNRIKKIYLVDDNGNIIPIKKGHVGSDRIYSAGNIVTYQVDSSVQYKEEVDMDATCLSPKTFTPTKSGWTFVGWRENTTASGDVLKTKTMGDNPITLYAVFQQNVTVTKYNGATTASTETKQRYYNNNNIANPSFTLSENTVSGWSPIGWTTSASGYSATVANGGSVTLSSNATYYSLYKQAITVTYYNNSSSASSTSKDRIVNYHNTTTYSNPSFTLAENGVSGWSARGWSTSNTGNAGITYSNNTAFTRDSNITLYSLYQRTVTVSYNGNGQTGGSTSASTGTAYRNASGATINASVTIRANGFSKTNYTFYRWRTAASSGTIYTVGSTYSSTADITLYAYWIVTTTNFAYTGGMQSFATLAGVTYLLKVWGAQGGYAKSNRGYKGQEPRGGYGGYAEARLAPGATTLWIGVGGAGAEASAIEGSGAKTDVAGGYNGGANGYKEMAVGSKSQIGGGGGATHIGNFNSTLANHNSDTGLYIVAGGGGGGAQQMSWGGPDYAFDGQGHTGFGGGTTTKRSSQKWSGKYAGGGGGYYGGSEVYANDYSGSSTYYDWCGGGTSWAGNGASNASYKTEQRSGNGYATIQVYSV